MHLERSRMRMYKRLRQLSIRTRLRTVFWIELLLAVCWCVLVVYSSIQSTLSYVKLNNAQITGAATDNARTALSSLSAVTKYPVIRTDQKTTETYDYLAAPWKYHRYIFEQDIKNNSQNLFEQHAAIRSITVFDLEGDGILFRSDWRYLYNSDFGAFGYSTDNQKNAAWFDETLSARGKEYIWSGEEIQGSGLLNGTGDPALFLSRSIFNTERFENVGVILASADLGDSARLFAQRCYLNGEEIGLFTPGGTLLFGTLGGGEYGALSEALSGQSGAGSLFLGGRLYTYSSVPEGFLCIITTPLRPILLESLRRQSAFLISLVLLMAFIAVSTNVIVNSITKPIRKLVRSCEQMRERKKTLPMDDSANDELAEFACSFNRMENEIESLIAEGYRKDLALAQTELHMLRQQINPHFLYNTLESIRSSARRGGQDDLEAMTLLLAKVLRYGVSMPDEIVTVGRELGCLEDYIRLQKLHYTGAVEFFVHVDKALLEWPIIKLLLQPLVENALYHGVCSLPDKGQVTVLGFAEKEQLIFQVIDNGMGIDSERLELINGYIRGENEAFCSVGLRNVNRRIQLYYGVEYGVRMESVEGKGAMAVVQLPQRPPESQRECIIDNGEYSMHS